MSDSEVGILTGTRQYGSLRGNDTMLSKLPALSNDTSENFLFLGITAGLLTGPGDYNRTTILISFFIKPYTLLHHTL